MSGKTNHLLNVVSFKRHRIQQSIFCGERQICVLNHLHGKHLREAIFPNWIRILSLTVYYHPPNFFPIRRRWFATRRMKDNNSKQEESQEIQRPTLLRKSIFPDWNTASECSDPAKNKRKSFFSSFHFILLCWALKCLFCSHVLDVARSTLYWSS